VAVVRTAAAAAAAGSSGSVVPVGPRRRMRAAAATQREGRAVRPLKVLPRGTAAGLSSAGRKTHYLFVGASNEKRTHRIRRSGLECHRQEKRIYTHVKAKDGGVFIIILFEGHV
jgi:hypothetical protein